MYCQLNLRCAVAKKVDVMQRVVYKSLPLVCVASEPELPLPRVCPCQNSGLCVEDEKGELVCQCPPEFLGRHCDTYAVRRGGASGNMAILVIPIVILLVLLSAGAIYVFIRKRPL